MTTIAWDGSTLAADSQYTGAHIETVQLQKIKKLSSGAYFAFAGNPGEAEQVRKWINAGRPHDRRPKVDDFAALIVRKHSVHFMDHALEEVPMKAPVAIGSGESIALTAMDCGKTAVEAVRLAVKRDPDTGGRVRSVKVR